MGGRDGLRRGWAGGAGPIKCRGCGERLGWVLWSDLETESPDGYLATKKLLEVTVYTF